MNNTHQGKAFLPRGRRVGFVAATAILGGFALAAAPLVAASASTGEEPLLVSDSATVEVVAPAPDATEPVVEVPAAEVPVVPQDATVEGPVVVPEAVPVAAAEEGPTDLELGLTPFTWNGVTMTRADWWEKSVNTLSVSPPSGTFRADEPLVLTVRVAAGPAPTTNLVVNFDRPADLSCDLAPTTNALNSGSQSHPEGQQVASWVTTVQTVTCTVTITPTDAEVTAGTLTVLSTFTAKVDRAFIAAWEAAGARTGSYQEWKTHVGPFAQSSFTLDTTPEVPEVPETPVTPPVTPPVVPTPEAPALAETGGSADPVLVGTALALVLGGGAALVAARRRASLLHRPQAVKVDGTPAVD